MKGEGDMKDLPGVPLKESEFKEGRVLFTEWRSKAEYAWDRGIALTKFFEGLKNGKIFGIRCPECNRVVVPPRIFCERCFREIDEWIELKDTGKVNTFSVSFVNWDASRRETPQVPAVVEIDGASPGIGFMHLLSDVGDTLEEILRRVKIGMKVKAVWKNEEEREGAITDILYFKPVED